MSVNIKKLIFIISRGDQVIEVRKVVVVKIIAANIVETSEVRIGKFVIGDVDEKDHHC